MLYNYTVIDQKGIQQKGEIEASNQQLAMTALQRRGFIVLAVDEAGSKKGLKRAITLTQRVPLKSIVIMSRQVSTLFEAQVPAVKIFNLVSESERSIVLKRALQAVAQDIQGGVFISEAMEKHPKVFSSFYVNMVKAGEESGSLSETFVFLADYLERTYELVSKTRNALVYPAFIIVAFIGVMVLMLTVVIPRLTAIIIESGGDIPVYTQIVIWLSNFLIDYGIFLLIGLAVGGFFVWRSLQTDSGRYRLDSLKISLPYFGTLFRRLYLSRFSDNMNTMLSSGITVVRSLEITSDVVGNRVYKAIIDEAIEDVKAGNFISQSLENQELIPPILVQMIRVGEETGSLGSILGTLSRFYKREVENAVDTLIGLIEPTMIIFLGVGVGFLLMSVLIPIYNVASGI